MEIISEKEVMRTWASGAGGRLGFVPTMGYLHEGHLALVSALRAQLGPEGVIVLSIFVNPTQFDRAEDLAAYPRDTEADLEKCREAGVDAVFLPDAESFYPADRSIVVDELSLSTRLCGATRPGHFAGVCLVLTKLFSVIRPEVAAFGRKDYQQLAIVRRLVRDLDLGVEILGVPTQREEDGLAMSSRNARLSEEMRALAPQLRQALLAAAGQFNQGVRQAAELCQIAKDCLKLGPGVKVDYLELVDGTTLQPIEKAKSGDLMAAAVFFGGVRLIDNVLLGDEG